MSERLPQGFKAAGVYTGVKRNPNKKDLALFVSETPAVRRAGVFTQNLVVAAPVQVVPSAHSIVFDSCRGRELRLC